MVLKSPKTNDKQHWQKKYPAHFSIEAMVEAPDCFSVNEFVWRGICISFSLHQHGGSRYVVRQYGAVSGSFNRIPATSCVRLCFIIFR